MGARGQRSFQGEADDALRMGCTGQLDFFLWKEALCTRRKELGNKHLGTFTVHLTFLCTPLPCISPLRPQKSPPPNLIFLPCISYFLRICLYSQVVSVLLGVFCSNGISL